MNHGTWRIAVVFAVSLLGANYVTGYEWLHAFSFYGIWGMIGLCAAVSVLIWFSGRMVAICRDREIDSLSSLFGHLFGKATGPAVSFLFHVLVIVFAGGLTAEQAALFAAVAGLPVSLGTLVPLVAVLVLTAYGPRQLTRAAAGWLAFGLACALLLVVAQQRHIPIPSLRYQLHGQWLFSSTGFVALHLPLAVTALLPFAASAGDARAAHRGVILGGAAFGLISLLLNLSLLAYWHDVNASSHPVLQVMTSLFPGSLVVYTLWAAVQAVTVIALWVHGLAAPLIDRFELRPFPVRLVCVLAIWLSTALALVSDAFASAARVGLTLLGMALLAVLAWKRN